MKKLFLIGLITIIFNVNFASTSNDKDWFNKYEMLIDNTLDNHETEQLIGNWVGIFKDKESTYLYNLDNEKFICEFENGIRSGKIKSVVKTSGVINVRLIVNDNAEIITTINRKTGNVIHCKAVAVK
ncbi:hypothetical protein [Flammeovirga kamogawensis]|uniref:DUF5640 domain-containing protein n=1 Tax=Flammeovirga kamogawensis TaxID=373891 RepID=A0ABX8H4H0_9BACT|nr:hypothetical protein [Flammeovirga kamogawensis]MBB6460242.1 hypothetical protein [Flammeovirga kamogawensis]QWG10055.1 hypothetical protein KM029_20445 [Flammeovirga kamogawensis]TRX65562.1 hypothetical protein EO216_23875 [Flammeovirga kamogawensis]